MNRFKGVHPDWKAQLEGNATRAKARSDLYSAVVAELRAWGGKAINTRVEKKIKDVLGPTFPGVSARLERGGWHRVRLIVKVGEVELDITLHPHGGTLDVADLEHAARTFAEHVARTKAQLDRMPELAPIVEELIAIEARRGELSKLIEDALPVGGLHCVLVT